jgi:hypothetical protein
MPRRLLGLVQDPEGRHTGKSCQNMKVGIKEPNPSVNVTYSHIFGYNPSQTDIRKWKSRFIEPKTVIGPS